MHATWDQPFWGFLKMRHWADVSQLNLPSPAHVRAHSEHTRVSNSSKSTVHAGLRHSQRSILVQQRHDNTASVTRISISPNLRHTSVEREPCCVILMNMDWIWYLNTELRGYHINHRLRSPRLLDDNKPTIYQNGNVCVYVVTMVHWLYVHVETREA